MILVGKRIALCRVTTYYAASGIFYDMAHDHFFPWDLLLLFSLSLHCLMIPGPDTRVQVTGGASVNDKILQVISDVFNAPVFTQSVTSNASSLGGCVRAIKAFKTHSREDENCSEDQV